MKYYRQQAGFRTFCYLKTSLPVLLILIFLYNGKVIAQVNNFLPVRSWGVSADIFFNHTSVTDKKNSSLTFTGSAPGLSTFIKYRHVNAEHEVSVFYLPNSGLKTNVTPATKLTQAIFNLEYANYYTVYNSGSGLLKCKAGGAIQFLNATRLFDAFINSNYSFETALSLGGLFEAQYSPEGNLSGFTISNRITLPFVFSFSQPTFSGNSQSDLDAKNSTAVKKLFSDNRLIFLPDFFRIRNSLALGKKLGNNHNVSIMYTWEYYKIQSSRNVILSNHQLGILYSYKFQ